MNRHVLAPPRLKLAPVPFLPFPSLSIMSASCSMIIVAMRATCSLSITILSITK